MLTPGVSRNEKVTDFGKIMATVLNKPPIGTGAVAAWHYSMAK